MNGTPPICDDNPQWLSYLFQGKPRNCAAEEPQQLAKRSTELGRRSRLGPWLPGRREEKSILREKPSEFHVDVPSNQSSDSCWGWPTPRRPSLRFARVAGLLWRQASTSHKEWLRHIYLNHVRSSGDGCEFKIINDTSYLCRYIYICFNIVIYMVMYIYIYIHTFTSSICHHSIRVSSRWFRMKRWDWMNHMFGTILWGVLYSGEGLHLKRFDFPSLFGGCLKLAPFHPMICRCLSSFSHENCYKVDVKWEVLHLQNPKKTKLRSQVTAGWSWNRLWPFGEGWVLFLT